MEARGEQDEARANAAASWLAGTRSTHAYRIDDSGTVLEANRAALEQLERTGDVVGRPLRDLAGEQAAGVLSASHGDDMLVTFARGDVRYALACRVFVTGSERWLIGEPPPADAEVEAELRRANNELAVLARNYAQQAIELRQALEDRDRTRWTLERIGEVLPVCMSCGALKTDTHAWLSATAFLTGNGVPLSHGYCPPCGERARLEFERDPG